ncbi:MAG: NUDIX domain-containing protein [Anaerolineaceae bacterium]|nr:NUDIX domain-containing protein [Anaerolineaceae bacterium]
MSGASSIRLRACVVVIEDGKILLVPHFNTDVGPIQWHIPGGGVEFGETLQQAAIREFAEETGLQVECSEFLGIYENIKPDGSWHSVSFAFWGKVVGGTIQSEMSSYGERRAQWFTPEEVHELKYHPPAFVDRALASLKH